MNDVQLQQEAAQRVQRMAERSRRLVREHPVNIYRGVTVIPQKPCPSPEPICEVPSVCEHADEPVKPAPPCATKPPATNGGWLSFLTDDHERVFLLLLILMLANNGAPTELLLALLYIAL